MKRILLIVVAALVLAAPATAANWPLAQLDQIGSSLAGKPVNVWCEGSWLPWESFFAQMGSDGTFIQGFTYLTRPTIYVNPKICEDLHALVGGEDVGTYHAAQAILVLTHEAMHQRLNSPNEALVECTALKLFPTVARDYFHVPTTIPENYLTNVVRKIRVGKKTRRVTVTVVKTRTIDNPYFLRLVRDAGRWDMTTPAIYHGATC